MIEDLPLNLAVEVEAVINHKFHSVNGIRTHIFCCDSYMLVGSNLLNDENFENLILEFTNLRLEIPQDLLVTLMPLTCAFQNTII